MNQKTLVSDLLRLEEMTTDTNLLIHIARIRERAENGFYHLAQTAEVGGDTVTRLESACTDIQAWYASQGVRLPTISRDGWYLYLQRIGFGGDELTAIGNIVQQNGLIWDVVGAEGYECMVRITSEDL